MVVDKQRLYRKRDRLGQLRAFCLAADLKSFTQAGERMGLVQPSVSLRVRELEHELEATLFERGGAGISLTPAGELLYEIARPLVRGLDRLPADLMERIDAFDPGRLRIAASVAGASIILPKYIKRLRDQCPELRVRVRMCQLSEGLELLLEDAVEFVLGAQDTHLAEDAVEFRNLLRYDIVLITSRSHPLAGRTTVSPGDVAGWPVIVPPAGAYSMQFGETAAQKLGINDNATITVGGWGVIKRYVENGLGIAVVPSVSIHETDQLSVIPLSEYFPTRYFGVYTRRGRYLTPAARRLLGLMGAKFPGPLRPPPDGPGQIDP